MTVAPSRFAAVLFFLALPACAAQGPKKEAEPAQVSYYRHIRPIFQQHCQGCHQPAKPQGRYVMTAHADLLKAGESDMPAVVPGKPDDSHLVEMINAEDNEPPKMPKGKEPLSERDRKLIEKWISQGAKDDTPASAKTALVDAEHPPVYTLPPVIPALAYSPDGNLLAVAGYHEVLLHHADGSGLVARLIGLSERIQSLAFSSDGQSLAVSGGAPGRFGEVQIWDMAKRNLRLSQSVTYDTVYGISWSPDGSKIGFGCGDNTLRAIESATGKQVFFQGAHNDWVLDTVFSVEGSHLVSVSRDRSMKLSEVATQRFIDNITSITPGALKGGLMAVDRHPLKNELACGGADGTPKFYQMHRTKKRVIGDDFNLIRALEPMPGRIFDLKYSRDGVRLVAGSGLEGKGEVRVYRTATRFNPVHVGLASMTSAASGGVSSLLFWPDVLCNGRLVVKCEGQHGAVYAVAFRPDGKQVASAGFDGVVRLNDAETGKLVKEFTPVPLTPAGVAAK